MIYAIKKKNESNERLISRFKKVVQRSRVIMSTKRGKFHTNPLTKKQIREAAVKRDFYRKQREKKRFYSS